MSNINDTYFDGHYKAIWKALIPAELTVKETSFMMTYFGLKPGQKVLDLMCGYGRHTLALAGEGLHVTAVDNLSEYTDEIKAAAGKEGLPVKVLQQSVIDYVPDDKYDLVICMGNSLNFFSAAETISILQKVYAALQPGGHLLINTWSLAEISIKNFKEKSWSVFEGLKFLTDSRYLFSPARIETESIIIDKDGNTETKWGVDYIFSLNEMESMLTAAGLQLQEVYSIPGKKKFTIGEPRAYLVAVKPLS